MAGASNSDKGRNVKCDNVVLVGHNLNEPKYRIVKNFFKYLAQDKSKPYYEDVAFSTLTPDKIPDPKKFDAKKSTLMIFEDLYSDPPAIQKKIIPFFSRGRHQNISSIYTAQKFHKIPIDFRENATHIVLCNGGGSIRKLADIIAPYTDADPHMVAKIIDGYLRQKEFIVINVNKPRSESFSLRWDSPLDLEKEIEALKDNKQGNQQNQCDKNTSGPLYWQLRKLKRVMCKKIILPYCSKIIYLKLAGLKISDALLSTILYSCSNLNFLILDRSYGFTNIPIIEIAKYCSKLLHLSLDACTAITDRCIIRFCPNLVYLNLNGQPFINNESICTIARSCVNLQHLDLSFNEIITDEAICAIATGCPDMQSYILEECERITNKSIKKITQLTQNLQKLILTSCYEITDDAVCNIIRSCPNIQNLNFQYIYITDKTIYEIAYHCSNLSILNVKKCPFISDKSIYFLLSKKLTLDIDCDFLHKRSKKCERITNKSIKKITQLTQNLQKLILTSCYEITDDAVCNIIRSCPNIQNLNFQYIYITDKTIYEIAYHCSNLSILNVKKCPFISDKSIYFLLSKKLTLDIDW
ncbi:hypothetical protein Glove_168g297 [Diversispora epigaea]|uniref:F-box/LRR-repeat protein 15-like leucin rich repeat domain-containing protein n=1 Tax=Diversispora epigaea TaxID=1348612 RepID=A0A397IY15_9GLOM|nr:hypothetical protein Glove_168g297 [Diversispora epigaea]